jgi:hypothetical protein
MCWPWSKPGLEPLPHPDPVVELAYDAAMAALQQQDGTLGNLRNRATALLSAAALATTFSAGVGLFNSDESRGTPLPDWGQWSLLGLLLATATLCIAVMWPVTMTFGADPRLILDRGADDINQVRRYVIEAAVRGQANNQTALMRKFQLYRIAVVTFTAETGVLLLSLILD